MKMGYFSRPTFEKSFISITLIACWKGLKKMNPSPKHIVCIVHITSSKLRPMAVQYTDHVIHVTSILHYYWRKYWWRNTDYSDSCINIINYTKMQNKNSKIITGANLRFSGSCGVTSFSYWLRNYWIWSV